MSRNNSVMGFFFHFLFLFLEKEKGRRKRERNINVWLPFQCPLLGTWPTTQECALRIELATLWFAGWHSIHWPTREKTMLLAWLSPCFQLLPLLPTSKLGSSGADSWMGGFVYIPGPCGSLQRTLLWGWEFLPQSTGLAQESTIWSLSTTKAGLGTLPH